MNIKSILAAAGSFGAFALLSAAIFLSPAQFSGGNIAHAADKCLDLAELGASYPKEGCDSKGDLCSEYDDKGYDRPAWGRVWGCLIPVTNKDGCFMRLRPEWVRPYRQVWAEFQDGYDVWYKHARSAKVLGNCVNGVLDGKITAVVALFVYHGPSKITVSGTFKQGVKHGRFQESDAHGRYVNGYRDGKWEKNGQSVRYSDGRITNTSDVSRRKYQTCRNRECR